MEKIYNYRLVGLFFLFMTSTVSASSFDGWYTGANIGVAQISSKYAFRNQIYMGGPSHNEDNSNPDVGNQSIALGVFLGVGKLLKPTHGLLPYIGIELNANYIPSNIKNNGSSTTFMDVNLVNKVFAQDIHSITLKNNDSFSILFTPGIQWSRRALLFALIGLDDATFKANVQASGFAELSDGNLYSPAPYVYRFSQNKLGMVTGLGMEILATEHFSMKLRYAYTSYGHLSGSDSTKVSYKDADHPVNITLFHRYSFNSIARGVITFGLAYHF